MILIIVGLLVLRLAYVENRTYTPTSIPKPPTPKSSALIKAERLSEEFKHGVIVYGKKNDGKWYKGTSMGYHDWRLYTTYFLIRLDDIKLLKTTRGVLITVPRLWSELTAEMKEWVKMLGEYKT